MRRRRISTGVMLLITASLLLVSCGGGGGGGCRMSGTITNNSAVDLTGVTYTVGIDTDTIGPFGVNGNEVATFQGVWPGGKAIEYSLDISTVTPGSYYVWVEAQPTGYALYGFYDGWTPVNNSVPQKKAPIGCGVVIPLFMDIT